MVLTLWIICSNCRWAVHTQKACCAKMIYL